MKIVKDDLSKTFRHSWPIVVFDTGEKVKLWSEGIGLSIDSLSLRYIGDDESGQYFNKLSNEAKIELCNFMIDRWSKLKDSCED